MNLEHLERALEQGERVGFLKPTTDLDYLGWILVAKLKANERLLEVLDPHSTPERYREEQRRLHEPYLILRIELRRSVHEAGDYETEDDYRQKDQFWFGSLAEVERQLNEWGYSLSDARSQRELDAP